MKIDVFYKFTEELSMVNKDIIQRFKRSFGLFIHWGLYAIPAWHEQIQWRRGIKRNAYTKLQMKFNPMKFHPDEWIDIAQDAGMDHICITAKHHDGFCLWNTRYTDYNVIKTPYGKDIIDQLANTCARRNFPLGIYYSVVDWHHPNYPNQGRSHELIKGDTQDSPNVNKYIDYLKGQTEELCSNYGPIFQFFWDMNVTGLIDPSINDYLRKLQPQMLINDRGFDAGDFTTPERDFNDPEHEKRKKGILVQANQSVGRESWGYKTDEDYYSLRHLIQSIDKYLSVGAGYLLNVGPKADGSIDRTSRRLLRNIGIWYRSVKESFIDVEFVKEFVEDTDILITKRGETIYVHLSEQPVTSRVLLKPIDKKPTRALVLNNQQPANARIDILPTEIMNANGNIIDSPPTLRVRRLPVEKFSDSVIVLRLDFPRDI